MLFFSNDKIKLCKKMAFKIGYFVIGSGVVFVWSILYFNKNFLQK